MTDKFKVGEKVKYYDGIYTVKDILEDRYIFEEKGSNDENYYATSKQSFDHDATLATPLDQLL